jgi:vitamin B12 transporter
MRRLPFCSLTLALMAIHIAHAAENTAPVVVKDIKTQNDDALVVTANRRETALSRTIATTNIITPEDILEEGCKPFVHEWLRGLPGVDIYQNGGLGNTVSIRLRGADSGETRYMRDGIPITDATGINGDPSVGFLDQSGISQVEIVRGAQSGLYGSAAAGGVVNLVGIRPTNEHHAMAQADYGSFNTFAGSAQATGPISDVIGFAASAGGVISDGFSASTPTSANGNPDGYEDDSYQRFSANARVESEFTLGSLFIAGNVVDGKADYDDGFPTDPNEANACLVQKSWQVSGGGTLNPTEDLQFDARAAHTDNLRQDPNTLYTRDFEAQDEFASLSSTLFARSALSVMLGADGLWQHARLVEASNNVALDRGARLIGVFAQVNYDHDWLSINAVGRHDDHSSEGSANTYRLGAAGDFFSRQYRLVSNIGTGFIAPSLYQLHDSFAGNPNLKAQTSLTADFGQIISLKESGLTLSNIAFVTKYDEKIEYDNNTFSYQNISSNARIYGIENDLRWRFEWLSSGATYTWQDSDDGTGKRLIRLPDHKMMVDAVAHGFDAWLRVYVEHVWSRTDGFGGNITLAPYTLLGASTGYALTKNWDVYGRLENLTDEDYQTVSGYSTAGRSIYGGVRATF